MAHSSGVMLRPTKLEELVTLMKESLQKTIVVLVGNMFEMADKFSNKDCLELI